MVESDLVRTQEQRLSHVETVVDKVQTDIKSVTTDVALLVGQVRPLNDAIQRIEGRLNTPPDKPQLTGIISAGASVLVLLAAVGISNLQPVKERVVLLENADVQTRQTISNLTRTQGALVSQLADVKEHQRHLEERIDINRDLAVDSQARLDEHDTHYFIEHDKKYGE